MPEVTEDWVAEFREQLPEFASREHWPTKRVTRFLNEAIQETNRRWGDVKFEPPTLRVRGMFQYAAHKLVVDAAVRDGMGTVGAPGRPAEVQSKTVGDETLTYAINAPQSDARADGLGDLRTTVYGQEFLRLRRRAGMGAVTTGQV